LLSSLVVAGREMCAAANRIEALAHADESKECWWCSEVKDELKKFVGKQEEGMIPAVSDVVEVNGCVGSVAGAANVTELCKVVVLCMLHSALKVIKHCCLLFLQSTPTLSHK
jgi:hypothetical protein